MCAARRAGGAARACACSDGERRRSARDALICVVAPSTVASPRPPASSSTASTAPQVVRYGAWRRRAAAYFVFARAGARARWCGVRSSIERLRADPALAIALGLLLNPDARHLAHVVQRVLGVRVRRPAGAEPRRAARERAQPAGARPPRAAPRPRRTCASVVAPVDPPRARPRRRRRRVLAARRRRGAGGVARRRRRVRPGRRRRGGGGGAPSEVATRCDDRSGGGERRATTPPRAPGLLVVGAWPARRYLRGGRGRRASSRAQRVLAHADAFEIRDAHRAPCPTASPSPPRARRSEMRRQCSASFGAIKAAAAPASPAASISSRARRVRRGRSRARAQRATPARSAHIALGAPRPPLCCAAARASAGRAAAAARVGGRHAASDCLEAQRRRLELTPNDVAAAAAARG